MENFHRDHQQGFWFSSFPKRSRNVELQQRVRFVTFTGEAGATVWLPYSRGHITPGGEQHYSKCCEDNSRLFSQILNDSGIGKFVLQQILLQRVFDYTREYECKALLVDRENFNYIRSNYPLIVCDNALLLIIKWLCWTMSIILITFKINILETGSASLIRY
jgi:hypothetical protein